MSPSRPTWVMLLAICVVSACESAVSVAPATELTTPSAPTTHTVASIAVSLAASSIVVGQTTSASAVPLDELGAPLPGHAVRWSSLDPTIATVSSSGVVTGVATGSVIIRATAEGVTGDAPLVVDATPVASVAATVGVSPLAPGQAIQANAFAFDSTGNALSGRSVSWSSLNPSIATVSITGVVTAVAPVTATIRATVESKTGDATLVVSAPQSAPAPSPSPSQQPVDNDSVFVSSARTWVNAVAPAALVQTPYHPSWTATIPGATWIWRTTVVATPMAVEVDTFTRKFTPSVTPRIVTLDVASDNGFKAMLNGTLIVDRLQDTGPTYATVSHYAIPVSAFITGTNTLTIIVQNNANPLSSDPAQNPAGLLYRLGISSTQPGTTASVAVALDSSNLGTTHSSNSNAAAKDASGTPLSGKTPTWASQNSAIATVNASTGVVTAVSAGSTRIQATIDGVVGSAPLTVYVPSVITAPAPSSGTGSHPNEPGGFGQLAAQSFDAVENTDFYPSGVGNPSIVTDATNPGSSTNVAQMVFPTGFGSGSAPGSEWVKHFYSKRTIYVSFWVKVSANWYGPNTSGANKILYWEMLNGSNAASMGSIELFGGGSDNLTAGLVAEGIAGFVQGPDNPIGAPPTVHLDPNVTNPVVTRGVWHHYEVLLTTNTPGLTDGSVKWWLDGTLLGNYANRIRFNSADVPFSDVYWSPTYGGTGSPVPATQYMWLKDLYISGQ